MVHREDEVLVALELDVGRAVLLDERVGQPARHLRAVLGGVLHLHQRRVVRHHLRGLELGRVPARRLVGRVLEQPVEDPDVALGVRLVERDERAGLVLDPAQQRVDHLRVRAVAVDEHQLVPAVVDERARDVVEHLVERARAQRDRADARLGVAQVLRRVAGPERRRVRDVGLLGGAARDLERGDRVGAQRQVRAVLLARPDRDQDDVRARLEPRRCPAAPGPSRQCDDGRASSGMGGLLDEGEVAVGDEVGERRVVDVGVDLLVGEVGAQRGAQRVDEARGRRPGRRGRRPDVGEREARASARRRRRARSRPRAARRSSARARRPPPRTAARAWRPGCGSSSCGRGSARGPCRARPG